MLFLLLAGGNRGNNKTAKFKSRQEAALLCSILTEGWQ